MGITNVAHPDYQSLQRAGVHNLEGCCLVPTTHLWDFEDPNDTTKTIAFDAVSKYKITMIISYIVKKTNANDTNDTTPDTLDPNDWKTWSQKRLQQMGYDNRLNCW